MCCDRQRGHGRGNQARQDHWRYGLLHGRLCAPRLCQSPKGFKNLNKFAQVVEIYKESDNSRKRRVANLNEGVANIVCLDDVPVDE
jgi:hypothetical protein